MRMQTFSGALLLVFQFACCFSIRVENFIGYPFKRWPLSHGALAPTDDNFVSVGLAIDEGVNVNGENIKTVHVRLHFMLDSCEIQCFSFINNYVCLPLIPIDNVVEAHDCYSVDSAFQPSQSVSIYFTAM